MSTEGLTGGGSSSSSGAGSSSTSSSAGGSGSSSGGSSSSGSSASGGPIDSGADADAKIVYSTGFDGVDCDAWGGVAVAGGVTGAACRVCGGEQLRRTFGGLAAGRYRLEVWGRGTDLADAQPSWELVVGALGGPAHLHTEGLSGTFAQSGSDDLLAAGQTLEIIVRLTPPTGCLFVDDLVVRRE